MYDIYIMNYLNSSGTSLISDESLVYSIPISDASQDRVFINPTIKTEMGKTGSMDFSIRADNVFYNRLRQMKTIIRVDYGGETLFRGRVLTIDDSHFSGEKKVHLEGDMAFFMDSQIQGVKDDDRSEISIYQHLQNIVSNHNSQMRDNDEWYKAFELGEVPGNYSSANSDQRITAENDKYGSNSWKRTMDELEELQKQYGGTFRTRFVPSGRASDSKDHCYLDWLRDHYDSSINDSQPIQVTSNIIDLNSVTEVDNLFTVFIPIGDNNGEALYIEDYTPSGGSKWTKKSITVPELTQFYTESQLTTGYHRYSEYRDAIKKYGTIYKVQTFSNAKTQEDLWKYALDWMKNNYIGGIRKFTVNALDLYHIDTSKRKYMCGDRVNVVYPDLSQHADGSMPTETDNLTVLSAQYYLHTPDKNSYSIGTPSDLLSKKYGKSDSSKKITDKAETYTPNYDGNSTPDTDIYKSVKEYKKLATEYIVNHRYNGDIYDQLMEDDPKKAERAFTSTNIIITEGFLASDARPTSGEHKKRVYSMMADGVKGSLTINGPVDHSHDFTDEQVNLINKNNNFMVIDATRQEFGLKGVMDLLTPETLKKPTATLLDMKIQNNKTGVINIYDENKKTDANAPQKVGISGKGIVNAITQQLGFDGTGSSATIIQDGLQAITKMFDPDDAGSSDKKETVKADGSTGGFFNIFTQLGSDATGDNTTILQDGAKALFSMFGAGGTSDPSSDEKKTAEIDGAIENKDDKGNTLSSGRIQIGKDTTDPHALYKAIINDVVTYKIGKNPDGSDILETKDGFITVGDVKIRDIDSFHTKFAIIDELVTHFITTEELEAERAYIAKLRSDKIEADSNVRSSYLYATNAKVSNFYGDNYYLMNYDGEASGNLISCFNGIKPTTVDSSGKVTITLTRIGPGADVEITFDQAATSFYKAGVAAAKKTGSESTYAEFTNLSLAPGESCGVTLYSDITGTKRRTKGSTGVDYTISAKKIFGLDVYDNDDNPGDSALPRNKYITEPLDIVSRYYYEDSNGNKVWTTGGACKVTPEQKAYYHLDVYDNNSSSESPLPSSKDLTAGDSITIGAWFYYLKSDGGKDWHKGGSVKVTAKDKHSKLGTLKCTAKSEAAGHVYYTLTGSDLTKAMKVDDTIEVYY